jgi:hypothetical protein
MQAIESTPPLKRTTASQAKGLSRAASISVMLIVMCVVCPAGPDGCTSAQRHAAFPNGRCQNSCLPPYFSLNFLLI